MAIEKANVIAAVVVRIDDTSFKDFWYLAARISSVVHAGG